MLVITLNPFISLFVIQEDAHQSLVLLQWMKRDEASSKYDAINPHQVYIYNSLQPGPQKIIVAAIIAAKSGATNYC